ncbi:MAG: glycosyltransferase family 2 protein [Bdellovibrionales bacterium]
MSTLSAPIVSVIIPVFNGDKSIARAIESARRQTLKNIEIIVVDDASTDGTSEAAQSLAKQDSRILYMRLPSNVGAGGARNVAIDAATGQWIAVLDADDWYEPERLDMLLKTAQEHQVDAICDNLKIFDHCTTSIVDRTRHGAPNQITTLTAEHFFAHDNPLRFHAMGYLKPMVRRDFLQQHNLRYDPSHRAGQDFIFLAEILLNGGKTLIVPDAGYIYVHRISPTTRKISPSSRSNPNFELIVRGCDELLARYGQNMAFAARHALKQRRHIFESRIGCDAMISALHEGAISKALSILTQSPLIPALVAMNVLKTVRANIFTRRAA